jgi:hypothetical protein
MIENITVDNYTDICIDIYNFYDKYISTTISITNVILNMMNVFIFIKLIQINKTNKSKGDFYTYLILKSIADAYFGIRFCFRNIIVKGLFESDLKSTSFVLILLYLIFMVYLGFVVQLISKITECFACFDRLIVLIPSQQNKNRKLIKIIFILSIIFSFLFYTFKFFQFQIIPFIQPNSTEVFYRSIVDSRKLQLFKIIGFIHSFLRDFLCVLISFCFNIATLSFVKKSTNNRRQLSSSNSAACLNLSKIEKLERAEYKIILMITFSTIIAVIGHWSSFLYYLPIETMIFENYCLRTFTFEFFYEISYGGNFIIYLIFNKRFRAVLLECFHIRHGRDHKNELTTKTRAIF